MHATLSTGRDNANGRSSLRVLKRHMLLPSTIGTADTGVVIAIRITMKTVLRPHTHILRTLRCRQVSRRNHPETMSWALPPGQSLRNQRIHTSTGMSVYTRHEAGPATTLALLSICGTALAQIIGLLLHRPVLASESFTDSQVYVGWNPRLV
jgi:hypothetical protein